MNIYLAGRYGRRVELCGYREQLRALGCIVDAVWLNGEHQVGSDGNPIGEAGEKVVEGRDLDCEASKQLRTKFALEDMEDVRMCNVLIAFTEMPDAKASRGGRHVELGMAIAWGKRVIVVGPRENIFCHLPKVVQYDSWEECFKDIEGKD